MLHSAARRAAGRAAPARRQAASTPHANAPSRGLIQRGGRYVNEFRTHPDPAREPSRSFTFIVLGDDGTGIRRSTAKRRQREVAESMQTAFDQHDARLTITGGDNIYAGTRLLGLPIGSNTGDEDATGSSRSSSRTGT